MLTRAAAGDRPGIDVIFEAVSLDDCAGVYPQPDVILFTHGVWPFLYSEMKDSNSEKDQTLLRLAQDVASQTAFLLLTDDPQEAAGLLNLPTHRWGALSSDCTEDELRAAVEALAQGLWVGGAVLMQALLEARQTRRPQLDETVEKMTERELQVLQLLGRGQANKQIAAALGISEHTVKFHLSTIFSKLNAANRAEAVRISIQQGLIPM